MSATASSSIRPEDAKLGWRANIAYGFQHVLTMYGGIIAPPLVMGQAAGMSQADLGMLVACSLFMGGLATLLQTLGIPFFGSRLPLVQGVSFSGIATMLAIQGDGGIQAVMGAVIVSSLIGILLVPLFAMVLRFFPPVVTGTVITSIGLSLMPVAAGWAMGPDAKDPAFGSPGNVGLAAATVVIIIVLTKLGTPSIARLSVLLSLGIGTILAVFLGAADFSGVADGPVFALPTPFAFGLPTFDVASILSMMIVILVTFTETTADILAVSEVVGTKTDAKRIADGLRADMVASAVSPVFNSFTQSAFAQNVGLVAITGVKSRFVVATGGVILIGLGVLPVLGRVIAAVPTPVLGGVGIFLFGSVAASGIATLAKVDYRNNLNLMIVAGSLGVGLLPLMHPGFYAGFPDWFSVIFNSAISSTTLTAVVLNIVFNHWVRRSKNDGRSEFAAAAEHPKAEKSED
ncbi:MAG TPA: nucleobase:cation symporter-2 family protein [Microbacterium sp.]|nr:nucleobase:cation symporter-2 family protein [Microbacterium sp.]